VMNPCIGLEFGIEELTEFLFRYREQAWSEMAGDRRAHRHSDPLRRWRRYLHCRKEFPEKYSPVRAVDLVRRVHKTPIWSFRSVFEILFDIITQCF
jgi:hypothetical protein